MKRKSGGVKPKGVKHKKDLLSATAVESRKSAGRMNDGGGLSLSITSNGHRRWVFRYSFGGQSRELMLGSTETLPDYRPNPKDKIGELRKARIARDKAQALLDAGFDPAESLSAKARKKLEAVAAGVPTFAEYAATYLDDLAPTFKNPKARQPWQLSLMTYAKPLHSQRLNGITTADVAKVLRPHWHTKRETARRLRWRLEAVFAAAIVEGYRDKDAKGNLIQQRNPAAWKDNLSELSGLKDKTTQQAKAHHPAMPFDQVPAFLNDLRGNEALSARALELAIFTATRTGEAIGARWDELDLTAKLWVIPASRMKAKREHVIPLSKPALELLSALPRMNASPFVFPGLSADKHLSNMSLLMLLRRMGRDDCTPHGFRSSFRTWASECTQFPREIAEMALAHQVGTEVERAYNRSTLLEKRRALADAWSSFCYPQVGGNVLKLNRR